MIKALSEFEPDIEALAERLRAASVGEIVTYDQLDQVLGRPVRASRYLLVRARERVEQDTGAVFAAVFRTGIKRLPIESYASIGQQARGSIRRKAKNASARMANGLAKANDAPPEVVRAISREQSVLCLLQYAARNSTTKRMLQDESITAPTPLAQAAKSLMEALGVKVEA